MQLLSIDQNLRSRIYVQELINEAVQKGSLKSFVLRSIAYCFEPNVESQSLCRFNLAHQHIAARFTKMSTDISCFFNRSIILAIR